MAGRLAVERPAAVWQAISTAAEVDWRSRQALVMCLANPSTNPRPRRVVELLLSRGCEVDLVSYPCDGRLRVRRRYELPEATPTAAARVSRLAGRIVRNCMPSLALKNLVNERVLGVPPGVRGLAGTHDLLTVHDLALLPLALRLKGPQAKVLCDLREFYPLEFEDSRLFRVVEAGFKAALCRELLHRCDALVATSPGIVAEYQRRFEVEVELIRSTPAFRDLRPTAPVTDVIRMVHHGNANRDRRLHNMIKLFDHLDERFRLDFYLTGDRRYQAELRRLAAGRERIRFLDPIPFERIIPVLNQYDVGLYLLEPSGLNTKYSLPNKIFEFIQARLVVATGPSPDMADVVTTHACGLVSPTFEPRDLAQLLMDLTPDRVMQLKRNSDVAAHELCFEKEGAKLVRLIEAMLHSTIHGR